MNGTEKSNPKNGHIKEGKTTRQKTSKNMGIVHKKSKKPKNVKNRQKTSKNPRNRDTVYIYIGKSHFSGIFKHRLQTMEDHSWQESSDSDQF